MKTEIPQFLIEMSKQLNEQDNRITADPLFEVRYKKYIVTEEDYNQHHWEVINDDGNSYYHSEKDEGLSELAEYLFEMHSQWCAEWLESEDIEHEMNPDKWPDDFSDLEAFQSIFNDSFNFSWHDLPDELKKLCMQEIEVTVNSHFTEADANAFIKRKQHDYPPLYTYAISMYFCENMKQLRNWIKDLNAA